MTITRSFGFEITAGGTARYWYTGKDGIRRWSDSDKPVTPDHEFIAAMSADLPPIHAPRSLDEMAELETSEGILALQSNNSDIDVSESALYPRSEK
mgnify:CR=1 FL=1